MQGFLTHPGRTKISAITKYWDKKQIRGFSYGLIGTGSVFFFYSEGSGSG